MAADPSPSTDSNTLAPQAETRYRVRLRFRKGRDLRLLSHHDLMRTFERMLRRADIPFRRSQGFHPKPKLTFALSLPLGVVGCAEIADVELSRQLPVEELSRLLREQAPPGLEIHSVEYVDTRRTAQVRRLCYRIALPPDRVPAVRQRLAELAAATELWVERKRPPARRVNLRPFLSELRLAEPDHPEEREETSPQGGGPALEMELWLTREGTARPEEVLGLVGLRDLVEAGVVLERTWLELFEDTNTAVPLPESDCSGERDEEPDAVDPCEEGNA
jgi:radical SAM-linked protein